MELTALAVTFFVTLLIGLPIYAVMGSSVLVYFLLSGVNPITIPHRAFAGIDVFVLMAVPFFMLAGNLMNAGGTTRRLVTLAEAMVGWVRGGLAHVNVVVSMLFAGISGSAAADTAAVGSIMIKSMKERGYSTEFATSVTVSSSLIGPIIPPSIILIVYAVVAGVSVNALFLAGIVPGILLGLAQMVLIAVYAWRLGFGKGERFALKRFLLALADGLIPLGMPAIILGGIFSGFFTPTEAAAVACLYALLVGLFIYRELKLRDLPRIVLESARTTGSALIIVAIAAPLSWILTKEQVPAMVTAAIQTVSDNPVVTLLLINLMLLVLGAFMEMIAALIILVPILLPVVVGMGMDPVHFGIVVAINLTIGMITPPVGISLFIGATIGRISPERLAWANMPFLIVSILVLLIITFLPGVVMFLPDLYGR
ncbi:TRAP transporter large permease [Roseovarius sp. ZX-A-9]|uniref:TRAP transporter large permease n=1 Tax=Roseovarius sp. ZX-A-9 TaxID=3014783 RepID=UPI00233043B7|nr:TRAP transporter large permease [Roseovarius sp. ZX-A-9]